MSIRVALNHRTSYHYDRLVTLGPQSIRLRPAPHCRTPILSYSLNIRGGEHFLNWQQDPHGNFMARAVFEEPVRSLEIEVDLIAEMTVINPFEFFVETSAEEHPFTYEKWLSREIRAFLETRKAKPHFKKFLAGLDRKKLRTVDRLVDINRRVHDRVSYVIRMEPGVQSPEETLELGTGSCRDSAWLLVHTLRHLGLAARFVSGYLIQLAPDEKSLDGPSGTEVDFTDLHAWAEVFIPGAGWIGMDPTSGLMAGEGHIPVACTPDPTSAAPITGAVDEAETTFDFHMSVSRIHEDPRVTKPYTDSEWEAIEALGHQVDARLEAADVRLTMGGEPTFISIDDMEGAEWNIAAVGPDKRRLSETLIKRLRDRFAPGGMLHYGQGKWYPGESLPRWALACFWREDGVPLWNDLDLIADVNKDYGHTTEHAQQFATLLAETLGVDSKWIVPAYEDVFHYMWKEQRLPVDVNPLDETLKDAEERARLSRVFERGINTPVGFVMPLKRQWWQSQAKWCSGPWPVRADKMFLLPGDSSVGLRLPLESLPASPAPSPLSDVPVDPVGIRDALPTPPYAQQSYVDERPAPQGLDGITQQAAPKGTRLEERKADEKNEIVRTALCVEPREGRIHVFMPPVQRLEDYIDLVAAIEHTASQLKMPVVVEGYLPPPDHRIHNLKVTPDPGVIEVNTHPTKTWSDLVDLTAGLYAEARLTRLGTNKFDLDGLHTGTGGGNHVVVGGATPADSPFLRRPDLLKSLIAFWINHPALSYLFSGRFIGPTSQAPRVDEGRQDALYELELAFEQVPPRGEDCPPWLVDRIFRNLLTDLTGNTHRSEFCIDKLFSPDSSTGRLGLVEFRGFEMPPHWQMSCTQQLLLRALIARFWDEPYTQKVVKWGTTLHDRFLLPHYVREDMADVLAEMADYGFHFDPNWFDTHWEFRFPKIGSIAQQDVSLELRTAIEPWYVLGEEPAGGGTARYVDSSVERMEVKVSGLVDERHIVTCNGRHVPLRSTGVAGEFVAGIRYRAWCPPSCLHPMIKVHAPLVFDILDTWSKRSIGGCKYHVSHPAGVNSDTFPINAYAAEARRNARFFPFGHSPGPRETPPLETNPLFPATLDLRRKATR